MTFQPAKLVSSPAAFFSAHQPTMREALLLIGGVAVTLPLINILYYDPLGPILSPLVGLLVGGFIAFIGWFLVATLVHFFIRKQSGYGFPRTLRYTAWAGIPVAALGVFAAIMGVGNQVMATGSITGGSAALAIAETHDSILTAANVTAILWQGWILLSAIEVGLNVERQVARGPVFVYVVVMLGLTIAAY